MTSIQLASPARKRGGLTDLPLVIVVSVGGLLISLLLTALTGIDGTFVAP